ncbi:alpha/beta hydrolase family protein [Roseimaritima ulvae]|uniref:Alpha/beta hydrolase family protein n=1 Tax=Roseimaritima ulvae TaxID=980254 RepID=A0A5B9QY04_9BACT|nr:alpha/beta fold hydrolase [Roseimaritima ulvae]QEG38833.1 Alpha/beta hydrolase family protein [Roseimaritima ulvae]
MKHLHDIPYGAIICLLGLLSAPSGFAQNLSSPDQAAPQPGSHEPDAFDAWEAQSVIDLPNNLDKARARNVPVTFHLPKQKVAQPLILVSHGGGGSRHGLYALAAETARQGYVVMCLEHVTSNTTDLRRRMRTQGLGFRDALRDCGDDMTARKNRPLDVRFAIDLAEQLNREDARFKGRIDLSQIAIVGHSYGAFTAMVCCGVKPVDLDGDLGEPRIKLGIALSPQSSNGKFFDEDSFATVTRPFVGISGTRDLSGDRHRDFFKLMPKGDKHLLWFHDANHFSFSDSSGSPRTFLRPDTDVTNALKVIVPKILDSYLRGEPKLDEATRKQLVDRSLGGKVRRIEWHVN